ncbi:MAG: LON peptidase substrate-binding domain-containing protein [Candidatus Nanopelagicales bacterium]|nr:LON peptidase substrate-binding domain-containing protein [Actinomycetota bacterium]NCG02360.1 peptidase S16 [Actinomycetales bacterium]MBT5182619.1 LON peptidase substrate-binding domain-containing protein [Actinomycetota bacterium]MBT5501762.1 LON peptidase substrate-binding domain-containing protein [Actinomycetota bacterium]MBT5806497.1 LON peptidase substrate-binding domain-containing protein [Actinomycetota bacterium]
MTSHISLFPLNTILVPGLVLPLHIFEPRYRLMVQELLEIPDEDEREFGVVSIRDGHDITTLGIDALHPIGISAIMREVTPSEDGRYDIVTTGARRFTVKAVDTSSPLLSADVEWLPEPVPVESAELSLLTKSTLSEFAAYRAALSGELNSNVSIFEELPKDPVVVGYLLTAAILLPTDERQALLGAETAESRLELVRTLLRRETSLIQHFGALPAIDLLTDNFSSN